MADAAGWRGRLALLLGAGEPAPKVAGSFAVALFCGTAPMFVGLVLLLPLLKLLKLSRFIGIGVTALLAANPFGIFVMVGQTWLGLRLLGKAVPDAASLGASVTAAVRMLMRRAVSPDAPPAAGASAAWDLLAAFLVGGFLSSLAAAGAVFALVWGWLKFRRSNRVGPA